MAVRKGPAKERESASTWSLQALPEEAWRDVLHLDRRADRVEFDRIVVALQKIDRALLPPSSTHPLAQHIRAGQAGIEPLLALLETGTEREWFAALDALSHVLFALADVEHGGDGVQAVVLQRLRALLHTSSRPLTSEQKALVLKTLALARDEELLRAQLARLTDDDPGVVATAARLLGLGRYAPAARVLRELVSPERFFESRPVLWALGEIGDPSTLPALYRCLAQAFRVVDASIAIGKIGQLTSVGELTPMLLSGVAEQRDAAVRALAMILDHHRNADAVLEPLRLTLGNLLETMLLSGMELSGSTRFHMCLCLARLGHPLDVPRLRRALGIALDDDEAGAMASMFTRRPRR